MTDIVLVHGSTQTAAGFWRLTDALQRRGHRYVGHPETVADAIDHVSTRTRP